MGRDPAHRAASCRATLQPPAHHAPSAAELARPRARVTVAWFVCFGSAASAPINPPPSHQDSRAQSKAREFAGCSAVLCLAEPFLMVLMPRLALALVVVVAHTGAALPLRHAGATAFAPTPRAHLLPLAPATLRCRAPARAAVGLRASRARMHAAAPLEDAEYEDGCTIGQPTGCSGTPSWLHKMGEWQECGMGSVVLLLATTLSLSLANHRLTSAAWLGVWSQSIGPPVAGHLLSLRGWVNEGLMAVFFFIVGLEIKQELYPLPYPLPYPFRRRLPSCARWRTRTLCGCLTCRRRRSTGTSSWSSAQVAISQDLIHPKKKQQPKKSPTTPFPICGDPISPICQKIMFFFQGGIS